MRGRKRRRWKEEESDINKIEDERILKGERGQILEMNVGGDCGFGRLIGEEAIAYVNFKSL